MLSYYPLTSSHLPTPQLLCVLKLYYQVATSHLPAPPLLRAPHRSYCPLTSSHLPTPQLLCVLKLHCQVASSHLPTPQLLCVLKLYYQVASSHLPAPQLLLVLQLYYKVASSQLLPTHQFASSQLPAPQIAPRTKVVLQSHQFSASSSPATPRTTVVLQSRQCSSSSSPDTPRPQVVLPARQFSSSRSPATPRTTVALPRRQFSASSSPATLRTRVAYQIALSPAFRALDTHDLRRGLRADRTNRTLVCISRPRHARSPQRVARAAGKSHSRLRFAHSTRTISAEGCAGSRQIALSPAFRALDTHDLRRGLRADRTNRTLACISRTRHARSPQRVARAAGKSHSRLHFAHSTRTISAEGCAGSRQIALSPAFHALDTHDLRRGLHGQPANRTLACISRTRHARSPQRVARGPDKSHSRLHFAHSTRTISAEGCTFG